MWKDFWNCLKDNIQREAIAHKITKTMLNTGRLEIGKGELPIQSLKCLLSDSILQERGLPKRQPPNQRLSGDQITYFHNLTFPEILRISGNVGILVGLSHENAKDKFNWLSSE